MKKYEHKYKAGKKEQTIPLGQIKDKVENANLIPEHSAYFWLLYWTGVRKSEAYERRIGDFTITDKHLIANFGKRKKGGAAVPALEIPRGLHGVNKIIEWLRRVKKRYRVQLKKIYVYQDKKRVCEKHKGVWVFPHIQSTTAWEIVKKVLGDGYYPHFLRLNRLTEIGEHPGASVTMMKSVSGIKSVRSIQAYMGVTKRSQKAAYDFLEKRYNKT